MVTAHRLRGPIGPVHTFVRAHGGQGFIAAGDPSCRKVARLAPLMGEGFFGPTLLGDAERTRRWDRCGDDPVARADVPGRRRSASFCSEDALFCRKRISLGCPNRDESCFFAKGSVSLAFLLVSLPLPSATADFHLGTQQL